MKNLKRFWKVLALTKKQNEIEFEGKHIAISSREKKLVRISQSIIEFIPLFAMFLVVNNPQLLEIERIASFSGFMMVSLFVAGIFLMGCVFGYLIWFLGMHKYL